MGDKDPEVSPFPNHVMMKNIQQIASSVSKGDNASMQHAGHILREKVVRGT